MRVGIVTRGDVFPTVHGAAVKIVRTAEGLGRLSPPCVLITDRKECYWRFAGDRREAVPYSPLLRRVRDHPVAREVLLERIGVPPEDRILFRPLLDLNFLARIVATVRREKLDVLQAEFPFYAVPMLVARALTGVRTSIMQHNIEHLRIRGSSPSLTPEGFRRIRRLEAFLCRNVQDVIALSEPDREHLLAMGVRPEAITLIPHGVDLASYDRPPALDVRDTWGIPGDAPLVYFHGTLHYGPNTVAVRNLAEEVMPRLRERLPGVHALVSGMGPPREHEAPDLRFTDVVEDLAGHIRAADVAVVPLEDGGGTRMKILEYMAGRVPIVSTRKGAEGLDLEHDHHALLADDGDWDGFARHVAELLEDPDRRRRIGEAGRGFVEPLDWQEIARRYVRMYREPRGPIERLRDRYRQVARKVLTEPEGPVAESLARSHEQAENEQLARSYSAYLEGSGPAPDPKILLLLLNKNCNLKCVFCDLWPHHDMMPPDRVRNVLEQAVEVGTRHVVLTGGEPLVLPHIFDVIGYAKDLGLGINMTSNGTLVHKRFDELVASGLDSISISVDGLDEAHDELRGVPSLETILRNVERLRAETEMKISIYFVMTHRNVEQLGDLYDFCKSIDAEFGFWPVNDYPHLHIRDPRQIEGYHATLDRLAESDPEIAVRREYFRRAVDYHSARKLSVRCLGLVRQYGVDVHGNVLPCCVWGNQSLTVGNLFETPLRELWTAPRTHALRRSIHDDGCQDLCYNHALYEFHEVTGDDFLLSVAEPAADEAEPPGETAEAPAAAPSTSLRVGP